MKSNLRITRNQLVTICIVIVIMITIFSPEPYGTPLRFGIVPLVIATLSSLMYHKLYIKFSVFQWSAFFLAVWIIVSTVFSDVVKWSSSARSTCLLIIFTIFLSSYNISIQDLRIIINWYCRVVFLCSIISLYRILTIGIYSFSRMNLPFIVDKKDVNYLSAFMVPGIVFLIYKAACNDKKRFLYVIGCIPPVLSVLLMESRSNFLTLLICFVLLYLTYLKEKKMDVKKIITGVVVFSVSIFIISWVADQTVFERLTTADGYKDNIRLKIWNTALEAFRNAPFIGSGLGASSMYSYKVWRYQSHNNFLDILGDHGIIGLFLFCLMIGNLLWKARKKFLHMVITMSSFFIPLAFINGFQTLNFWIPMIIIYYVSDAYENGYSIEQIYYI